MDELLDFLNMTRSIIKNSDSPPESIGKTEIKGLVVSTVNTHDMGWETAIIDSLRAHPVQRYETREKAEAGHKYWEKIAGIGIGRINRLGYNKSIPSEEYVLVPNKIKEI